MLQLWQAKPHGPKKKKQFTRSGPTPFQFKPRYSGPTPQSKPRYSRPPKRTQPLQKTNQPRRFSSRIRTASIEEVLEEEEEEFEQESEQEDEISSLAIRTARLSPEQRHLKKSPKNQRPNKALYFPKGNQIVKMHYYDYLGL